MVGVDPMVAVITLAIEGSTCDKPDHIDGDPCGAPAAVAISLDAWDTPLMRCSGCWPPLDEILPPRDPGPRLSNY